MQSLTKADFVKVPTAQASSPGHMQGIRECVRAQGRIAPQSRLRYAALCVMVRQENYLALINMCPIGWDLDAFTIPKDPDPSDELSWTMLVVRLCADLVQFSHEQRSQQNLERWQHLKAMNEQWRLTKPKSFEASIYERSRQGSERTLSEILVSANMAQYVQHYQSCESNSY